MSANGQLPTFNLKAVVQETGLKPDTLRAWERRYGLPQPERTDGGHRVYSKRDIETLKWLVARQQEGMSISRAINLWHQLESDGKDPLLVAEFGESAISSLPPVYSGGEKTKELSQAWVAACLEFDEQKADQVLNQAFALYSPELVCFEVLQKALTEIGDGWHKGEITIQQEHFASALAMRRLESMVAATPPPSRPGKFLVGCAPGEEHTFNPLLLTYLLRRNGWEAIYLGANVPAHKMEITVAQTKPQLVILTAQQLNTAASLLEMTLILRREDVAVAYGGLIFNIWPAIRKRIPAHFLGERMDLAPQAVEKILRSLHPLPPVEPLSKVCQEALDQFHDRRASIEARVWEILEPEGLSYSYLASLNGTLARNIRAALILGNIEYIGTSLSWMKGLFDDESMTTERLSNYLMAYHQAAQDHLGEAARPILEWFASLIPAKNIKAS